MNPFARTQVGVAAGMALGLLVTVVAFAWPALPTVPQDTAARIGLWLAASVSAALWLLVGIALLARHRFFSRGDIDGGGFGDGTGGARLLQALIQNTLEQVVLAIPAYGAWLWLAPEGRRGLLVLCVALFSVGRLLFFVGYRFGAAARASGFTFTFYPTVGLYIFLLPGVISLLFG